MKEFQYRSLNEAYAGASPYELLELENFLTKSFFKNGLLAFVFGVLLLIVSTLDMFSQNYLFLSILIGVISLYLITHHQLKQYSDMIEGDPYENICMFEVYVIKIMAKSVSGFYGGIGILFLIEPLIRAVTIGIENPNLLIMILEWRWIIIVLIILNILRYLIYGVLTLGIQNVILKQIKEMSREEQIQMIENIFDKMIDCEQEDMMKKERRFKRKK